MWLDEVGPAMIGAMSKHCLVRKRMTAASEAQFIATSDIEPTSAQTVSVLFPDVAPVPTVVTSLNVVRVLSVSPPARAAEDLAGCG